MWVGSVEKSGLIQRPRLLATVKEHLDHKVYILLHAHGGGLEKSLICCRAQQDRGAH